MSKMRVNTVTIIGANGTMGRNVAAIYASFGNAKVYLVCRDIDKANKAKELAVKSVRADAIAKNLIPVDFSIGRGKIMANCGTLAPLRFSCSRGK